MLDRAAEQVPEAAKFTLLKASTMIYLFRALTETNSPEGKRGVELHLIRLVNDVSGTDGGFVVLAEPGRPLGDTFHERDFPGLDGIIERVTAEGIVHLPGNSGATAGPLYVRNRIAGVMGVLGPDCSEVLGAVLTLASTALGAVREFEELRTENILLKSQTSADDSGMIGESKAIFRLKSLIDRVAPQDASVLILGESGTGKELVARTIHARSRRSARPFVAINCAALSETLLESDLFGHERGAFTGAVERKKGKLEMAEGGTVFLDEIGELAPGLQAKLLRVLQERNFERVGGTQTLPLDIRLLAATNRDLSAEAKRGHFRLDLFHRLNVIALKAPPLRERMEDIPLLTAHFLKSAGARCGRHLSGATEECLRCLTRYPWPGNIRELQNAIEHAVILGSSEWLTPADLPETVLEAADPADLASPYHAALSETRRECVIRAWNEANGDHDRAASILGVHPNSLRRLIRHLGLKETLRLKGTTPRADAVRRNAGAIDTQAG
jgi:transcriptional regulator with GAF, ATPase, and Fis domain